MKYSYLTFLALAVAVNAQPGGDGPGAGAATEGPADCSSFARCDQCLESGCASWQRQCLDSCADADEDSDITCHAKADYDAEMTGEEICILARDEEAALQGGPGAGAAGPGGTDAMGTEGPMDGMMETGAPVEGELDGLMDMTDAPMMTPGEGPDGVGAAAGPEDDGGNFTMFGDDPALDEPAAGGKDDNKNNKDDKKDQVAPEEPPMMDELMETMMVMTEAPTDGEPMMAAEAETVTETTASKAEASSFEKEGEAIVSAAFSSRQWATLATIGALAIGCAAL